MPTVQTNDIETHYETRGNGPPLIFIHGALADHSAATRQLAAFSDTYTAIAYDLRGHGNTANPRHEPYSIDRLAEDIHAFITELDLENPVLCGVSMGGMVAQVYASRYPNQLRALVLADTFSPAFLGRRDRIERFSLVNVMAALVRLVGYNRAKGLLLWLGRKLERDQTTSLRPEAFPDMETVDAVNSLKAAAGFHTTDIDLTSITVPTLVLYGEHEPSVISRHVPVLSARIPDSTVQEVPDAGHASPWDNPEFFNSTIRAFLTSQPQIEVE
ncbi:alpha/beta hydrolase [Haloferax larsenii]|uniref:Alpha/beta hydrolase n=1 Tax=Haloferax larsenii TaxID=302484 RepID=A0ABY5RE90_HALLR|nr:alpha/beta hydrolase [Haloferax larsenii]ELZ81487.1 hydrolase or acyltransferase of alpha/beta superfamily protein [Haloferax larsenii JCM 13917]UVE49905.1 alpha/beta hydrolase [Haloferax larsenii]